MNEKQLMQEISKTKYGTKNYYKLELIDMVNSVYCYNNYKNNIEKYMNNEYIKHYLKKLTESEIKQVVKKQVNFLCKNSIIIKNVGTDCEGVNYNSLHFTN